jgi:hypothetical protein
MQRLRLFQTRTWVDWIKDSHKGDEFYFSWEEKVNPLRPCLFILVMCHCLNILCISPTKTAIKLEAGSKDKLFIYVCLLIMPGCLCLFWATKEGDLYMEERVCVKCKVLREDLTLFRHSISSQFPPWEQSWLHLQTACVVRRKADCGGLQREDWLQDWGLIDFYHEGDCITHTWNSHVVQFD